MRHGILSHIQLLVLLALLLASTPTVLLGQDVEGPTTRFRLNQLEKAAGVGYMIRANSLRNAGWTDSLRYIGGRLRVKGSISVDTLTQGSVLYAGASGLITQRNNRLFWSNTANTGDGELRIGGNGGTAGSVTLYGNASNEAIIKAVGGGTVTIRGAPSSYITIESSSATQTGYLGWREGISIGRIGTLQLPDETKTGSGMGYHTPNTGHILSIYNRDSATTSINAHVTMWDTPNKRMLHNGSIHVGLSQYFRDHTALQINSDTADQVPVFIRGASGQNAPLFAAAKSDSVVVFSIGGSDGVVYSNGVTLWEAAPGDAPYSNPAGTYLWTVDENGQNGAWADLLGFMGGSGGTDQMAYFSDANTLTSDASLTYDGSSAITIDDGSYSGEYSNYSITISDAGTAYGFYADPYQINNIWDDSGVSAMRKGSGYLSGALGANSLNGTSSSRYNQAGTDAPLIFGIVGASDDGNNSVGGELALRSSRTTSATAHGVTQSGDLLGRVTAWGNYDQTGATLAWSGKTFTASMAFKATETFSNTARGSKIVFSTTDNTTTTVDDRLTIDHDGSIYSTGGAAHDVTFDDVDQFSAYSNDQWLYAWDGAAGFEGTYTNSPRTYKYGAANTLDGQGYSYLYSQRQSGTGGDLAFGVDSTSAWFGTNYDAILYRLPTTQPDVSSGQQSILQQDGNGSNSEASWKKVASGITTGTTDGSGDLSVTCVMDDASYLVTATAEGTTFYTLTAHTKGTTSFKVRVFDAAGAAVTSTSVTVGWWLIDQ